MTSPWSLDLGETLEPGLVDEMREALSANYGVVFDTHRVPAWMDPRSYGELTSEG